MEFPSREAEIETLAHTVVSGLGAHLADFPDEPVIQPAKPERLKELPEEAQGKSGRFLHRYSKQ